MKNHLKGADSDPSVAWQVAEASGVTSRPLTVSHAFHSPLMQPMLDDFRQEVAKVTCCDGMGSRCKFSVGSVKNRHELDLMDYLFPAFLSMVFFSLVDETRIFHGYSPSKLRSSKLRIMNFVGRSWSFIALKMPSILSRFPQQLFLRIKFQATPEQRPGSLAMEGMAFQLFV